MQYEAFFGFQRRPFAAGPQAAAYFPAETCEAARKSLLRAIDRGAGPGLLIGPPGTGKSLIFHLLASELGSRFQVVPLMDGTVPSTRRELWQTILFELDLPYKGLDEGELRLAVIGHLTRGKPDASGLALLVDDAQHLALEVLEELRLLGDIIRHGVPRVRVALAGGAALEEKLAHPHLDAFSQRIAARAYLQPLNRDETHGYIGAQLSAAGGPHHIFVGDAVDQIYRAADGTPRLINQLCDQALLLAAQRNVRHVDARMVEEAWSELQQLPGPWSGVMSGVLSGGTVSGLGGSSSRGAEIIEFGTLDELPAAVAAQPVVQAEVATARSMSAPKPAAPKPAVVEFGALSVEPKVEVKPATARPPVVMKPAVAAQMFEEEIVVDRYAALDARLGGKCRRVYLADGLDLMALTEEPKAVTPPAAAAPQAAAAQPAPAMQAAAPVLSGPIAPPPPIVPSLAVEPVAPPRFVAPQVDQDMTIVELPVELPRTPVAAEPASMGEPAIVPMPAHDDDLIVVEEDPDYAVGLSLVTFAPVRREEYRTLFTRLRQGGQKN